MLNKTQLIGRLGADPEVRSLNDGAKVTNLRIATTETWKDRETGERKERTEWHRVTVWGDGAAKYLGHASKGAMLLIEGRLCTRKWSDSQGIERTATEIVVQSRAGGQIRFLGRSTARRSTRDDAKTRIGIDLTFSAPKNVSLLALVGGDAAVVAAHDRAVTLTLQDVERRAQARQKINRVSGVKTTGNLIIAKFRHETTRAYDPALHTHAVVMNLTKRADGE